MSFLNRKIVKFEKGMSPWAFFLDSYYHYRKQVGLGRLAAIYRALYYEIKKKEPWA